MKNDDLVTIIIPVYNAEKYIAQTISSIESQTYTSYEAIVIDDCSTDNSLKIIEENIRDNPKFKVIKLKRNKGVAFARNVGIRKAKGRYLTFLDSDDIWLKDKLEKQVTFTKENDYAFTYSSFKYMTDDGKSISKKINVPTTLTYNKALLDTRILTLTAMIDLNKIPKYRCYMPNIMHEDMATWWRLLRTGIVAHAQNNVLAYCRMANKSRSSNKIKSARYRWKLYRKTEKLGLVKASYCFVNYVLNAIIKRVGIFYNLSCDTLQVAVSTQNLKNDKQVNDLITEMKISTDYLIINQNLDKDTIIFNDKVITKHEKGLSKSRNAVLDNASADIILFADDDVIYNDEYNEIILDAYNKYPKADMICFYVDSMNKKRKTKRFRTGKLNYITAMMIISAEMSCRRKSFLKNNIRFDEEFGIGTKNNRGEEQILIYEALKKGLEVVFVNKKIADISQQESSWFMKYNENFFEIQGKVFRRLTNKYYLFWILQYGIRKYSLYKEDISMRNAIKSMIKGAKEYK